MSTFPCGVTGIKSVLTLDIEETAKPQPLEPQLRIPLLQKDSSDGEKQVRKELKMQNATRYRVEFETALSPLKNIPLLKEVSGTCTLPMHEQMAVMITWATVSFRFSMQILAVFSSWAVQHVQVPISEFFTVTYIAERLRDTLAYIANYFLLTMEKDSKFLE